MDTGAIIGSMTLCILMGSCAILNEFQDFLPDDISDGNYCAFLVAWGLFIVSVVGIAASGVL